MSTADRNMVIIRDDRMWKSIASDVFTVVVLIGPILAGHFLGSLVLQSLFGFMVVVWSIARAGKSANKAIKTIPQARRYLDELERDQ